MFFGTQRKTGITKPEGAVKICVQGRAEAYGVHQHQSTKPPDRTSEPQKRIISRSKTAQAGRVGGKELVLAKLLDVLNSV